MRARRRPLQQPSARAAPPSHSPHRFPGLGRPSVAPGRWLQAGAGGGRTTAGNAAPAPALPGAVPGAPRSLPRAPRLTRQAPGPGCAAVLPSSVCACAAHLRGQVGGRGGDETDGGGDRGAEPGRDHRPPAPGVTQGPALLSGAETCRPSLGARRASTLQSCPAAPPPRRPAARASVDGRGCRSSSHAAPPLVGLNDLARAFHREMCGRQKGPGPRECFMRSAAKNHTGLAHCPLGQKAKLLKILSRH
jgi:hypothetical protein